MSPRSALPYAALLLACFAAGSRCALASGIPELPSVTFRAGHPAEGESIVAALDEDSRATLEHNRDLLKTDPGAFALLGYTDDRECSGQACEALARRRARGLYDWLIANGVDPAMLPSVVAYDETRPIDDNETEEGRARNRRVEFLYELPLSWRSRN
jgi:OOP family OmpA-OmpF porin